MLAGRRIHWGRWVFYAAATLLALWLVWAGRNLWFPVALAFVIAIVLDPTVDRLENRGISRGLGTALVFTAFLGAAALIVFLLTPAISAQLNAIAVDLGNLLPDPDRPSLVPATQKILDRLHAHPALRDALLEAARTGTERLSQTMEGASELTLAWAPNLIWLIVVPVLAFYMLNDFHRIYAKGILLVPKRHRSFAQTLVAEISAVFGKYLRGLALICGMLGVSIALLLYVLGCKYWQLLGLLGGLLYAIPAVGALFNAALVFLVMTVTATPGKALLTTGCLLLLTNGLFDQVITPRVIGRQVGLHPILTILALMLGYQIAGVLGMLVAVPLAASVQTIVVHLVPKLGADLELKPLEELRKTEAETRSEHLRAEERADDHLVLQTVIASAESREDDEEYEPDWDVLGGRAAARSRSREEDPEYESDWDVLARRQAA